MAEWFSRPVVHVRDVAASLRFYVDRLGFASPWAYDEDGDVRVAQVERRGCALILSSTWPQKSGGSTAFVSLDVEPPAAMAAALDALRAEWEAAGVPVAEAWWGYRILVVEDPDGNQLLFNYPNEPH